MYEAYNPSYIQWCLIPFNIEFRRIGGKAVSTFCCSSWKRGCVGLTFSAHLARDIKIILKQHPFPHVACIIISTFESAYCFSMYGREQDEKNQVISCILHGRGVCVNMVFHQTLPNITRACILEKKLPTSPITLATFGALM